MHRIGLPPRRPSHSVRTLVLLLWMRILPQSPPSVTRNSATSTSGKVLRTLGRTDSMLHHTIPFPSSPSTYFCALLLVAVQMAGRAADSVESFDLDSRDRSPTLSQGNDSVNSGNGRPGFLRRQCVARIIPSPNPPPFSSPTSLPPLLPVMLSSL